MYIVTAMQVTIYLSKELGRAVKAADIPLSEVCQRALRRELARLDKPAVPDRIPGQLTIPKARSQQWPEK